jgi:4-hydroxy-tetrahydrodipicolinate synthase
VDALLIVTPYYIRPQQRALIDYFLEVTNSHETPWMVYHTPGRSSVGVTIETLATLRDRSKTFVGIKHASDDIDFVSECMIQFGREFRVFVGLDELSFPMMAVGACGLMTAAANIVPRPLAELYAAVLNNDLVKARAIHERLFAINKAIFFDTNPIPLKYMMKRLGLLTDNEHRLPLAPATEDVAKRLDEVLHRGGLINKK